MCMKGMDIEAMETCKRQYNHNVSQLGDPDMQPYCNIDHCWNTVKKKNIHIGLCSEHIDEHEATTLQYEATTDHHQQVRAEPPRPPAPQHSSTNRRALKRTRSPVRLQSSSAMMRRDRTAKQNQLREVADRLARICRELRDVIHDVSDMSIDDEDL